MSFILQFKVGTSALGRKVQDANLPGPLLREAYHELLLIIWRMYRVAKLVHGDLSEYNILYHERQVYIIDVSQSVDLDHPKALDFLREDCQHVNDFFRRAGVAVLSVRELFDWVTDPLVRDDTHDSVLDSLQQVCAIKRLLCCLGTCDWRACMFGIASAVSQLVHVPTTAMSLAGVCGGIPSVRCKSAARPSAV